MGFTDKFNTHSRPCESHIIPLASENSHELYFLVLLTSIGVNVTTLPTPSTEWLFSPSPKMFFLSLKIPSFLPPPVLAHANPSAKYSGLNCADVIKNLKIVPPRFRVLPKSNDHFLMKEGEISTCDAETREQRIVWKQRQRQEQRNYKQKNFKDSWLPPVAKREAWNGFSLRDSRKNHLDAFDFGLLACRIDRGWISVKTSKLAVVMAALKANTQGNSSRFLDGLWVRSA